MFYVMNVVTDHCDEGFRSHEDAQKCVNLLNRQAGADVWEVCSGEDDIECDEEVEDDWLIDGVGFADEGGGSALRAATRDNPRNQPCPTCDCKNRLTPMDVRRGYQCDQCADRLERGGDW